MLEEVEKPSNPEFCTPPSEYADGILHSQHRENLKSYIVLDCVTYISDS
jgi:hypothetical protein